MHELNTYFEQVPLEVAKQILAREFKRKQAAERAQASTERELEDTPSGKSKGKE